MTNEIKQYLEKSHHILTLSLNDASLLDKTNQAVKVIVETFKRGNRVLIAGNGGSAADAQHIAGEFVSRFYIDRPALPAIALTTDSSILTAIGNDYGYEQVFERQLKGLGQKNDLFIGLSTSGSSKNVLLALEAARAAGIFTIGMTGKGTQTFLNLCDICLQVPSTDTPFIQQVHMILGHAICMLVEKILFEKPMTNH